MTRVKSLYFFSSREIGNHNVSFVKLEATLYDTIR